MHGSMLLATTSIRSLAVHKTSLAVSLEPLAHRRNVASPILFIGITLDVHLN